MAATLSCRHRWQHLSVTVPEWFVRAKQFLPNLGMERGRGSKISGNGKSLWWEAKVPWPMCCTCTMIEQCLDQNNIWSAHQLLDSNKCTLINAHWPVYIDQYSSVSVHGSNEIWWWMNTNRMIDRVHWWGCNCEVLQSVPIALQLGRSCKFIWCTNWSARAVKE